MNHTPGPWRIIGQDVYGAVEEPNNYICTWSGRSANARIIAAAPAMYEALTKMVSCLETIKANSVEMEKGVDWFDWCFINQEIKHSKKVLKGGQN